MKFTGKLMSGIMLFAIPGVVMSQQSSSVSKEEIPSLEQEAMSGSIPAAKKLYENYYFSNLDYEEGMKWLRICAENGDSVCEYNLGFILVKSKVKNDRMRGEFWLRRSADKGSVRAKELLIEINGD
ncbi:hypothetical protein [Luteimonas aquatica]|uniref:hypothetical protein n=1 Tax=Luteimonas aquatica TaxID=450364 RepID=UPI001F57A772|nr:hypothetical protein [Luteimonas aquatica]